MSSDEDPELRRAAVRALQQVRSADAGRLVAGLLDDPVSTVRATAAEALAEVDPEQAVQPLVDMLADPDSAVRVAVARALGRIGRPSVPGVVHALDRPGSASGALLALEHLPIDGAAEAVRRFAGESVQRALRDHQFAVELPGERDERLLLLHDALARSSERHALDAIRAVAVVSSDRSLLSEAIGNLEAGDTAQRAAAVELIDSSKDAPTLRPLVAVWESGQVPRKRLDDPISKLLDHPDPWIRECAEFAMSATMKGKPMARTLPTLAVMERVLFLRKAPMFEGLPPEDLKRIGAVADEAVHSDGDVIVAEGEAGTEMLIIVSGEVVVVVNGREVARRREGDVVGEMAAITNQPRMATLVATGDVRLLTIGQRQFAGILRERPETSFAVMRVLARRLTEREASSLATS
jgi:CRP/FNR family transcriptional regulator, cyclic AMP receptor protein